MSHATHHHHANSAGTGPHARREGPSLDRIAWMATLHCLFGCAIGEVAGLSLGTALGWSNGATIALAVGLAFLSGYSMTMIPLLRSGQSLRKASRIALAADTASIALMELVDNAAMLAIPGAMDASLDSGLFWFSLALSLSVAAVAAYPLNRWLIAKGRGHAIAHGHH